MSTATEDIIEGEATRIESAVAVVPQPGQALVAAETGSGPTDMLEKATHIATALTRMVEAQKLYTLIQGKKYPQVEAWMTIGRMDNVVAREAGNPERHEDGSYEAVVELVRLSDGMVIGRGSALCGTKGDRPWDTRAEPARRSMAVTRATSRAFRQQYSWIMALAGYEPTPADEMPHNDDQRPVGVHSDPPPRPELERRAEGLVGTVTVGKPPCDLEVRQTPTGPSWGFKLAQGRKGYQALAIGPLADALSLAADGDFIGTTVTVWGRVEMIPWEKKDPETGEPKSMPPYARIAIERVATPDWILPAEEAATEPIWGPQDDDLSDLDF